MTQWVKYLPCKHESLRYEPQCLHKVYKWQCESVCVPWFVGAKLSLEAAGMVRVRFRGRPCLKNQGGRWEARIPDINLWPAHMHACMHEQMHTPVHIPHTCVCMHKDTQKRPKQVWDLSAKMYKMSWEKLKVWSIETFVFCFKALSLKW